VTSEPFNSLDVRFISERRWILLHDLIYFPSGERVPKGFDTDFASIPKLFHGLLSPVGKYAKAAVFHDFGYTSPPARTEAWRKVYDDRFLEMMVASGVGWFTRNLIHRAVRDFGAIIFHAHGKE